MRHVQYVVRIATRVHALFYGDDSQNESDDKRASESDDKAANASNDKKAYESDEKGANPRDGNGANESNEKVENPSDGNAAIPSPPRGWICPLCAFKIEPDILICDVCNTVKPFSDEEEDEELREFAAAYSRGAIAVATRPRSSSTSGGQAVKRSALVAASAASYEPEEDSPTPTANKWRKIR